MDGSRPQILLCCRRLGQWCGLVDAMDVGSEPRLTRNAGLACNIGNVHDDFGRGNFDEDYLAHTDNTGPWHYFCNLLRVDNFVKRSVEITSENGMHARPSAALARISSQFGAEIFVEMGSVRVNAKSIMGLLTLAAAQGAHLQIEAVGEDAEKALSAIVQFMESEGIATCLPG